MARNLTAKQKYDYVMKNKIKSTKIVLFSKEISDHHLENAEYGILQLFFNMLSDNNLRRSWSKEEKGGE